MAEEYKALIENDTSRLVPRLPGANVVTGKWLYKHMFYSYSSLAWQKARWVIRGFSQQVNINYDETFSTIVKPGRSTLSSRSLPHVIGLFISSL